MQAKVPLELFAQIVLLESSARTDKPVKAAPWAIMPRALDPLLVLLVRREQSQPSPVNKLALAALLEHMLSPSA